MLSNFNPNRTNFSLTLKILIVVAGGNNSCVSLSDFAVGDNVESVNYLLLKIFEL